MNLIDNKHVDLNELQQQRDNEYQLFDDCENRFKITLCENPVARRLRELKSLNRTVVAYSIELKPNFNDVLTLFLDTGVENEFTGTALIIHTMDYLKGLKRI